MRTHLTINEKTESTTIPCSRNSVYERLDLLLRQSGTALISLETAKRTASTPAEYKIFEVQLRDRGTVRELTDIVKRARELEAIEPYETPSAHWTYPP